MTETGRGSGFHITADMPVRAIQFFPYAGAVGASSQATLLIPSVLWGKDHVAVSAYLSEESGDPNLTVLASEDDTDVTIVPFSGIEAGPLVAGALPHETVTYGLDRGEYIQFSQLFELTGSPVASNKPIAMFGGHRCFRAPSTLWACDVAQQQIPPEHAIGHEYVGVTHLPRNGASEESPPWRLVGMTDGTALSWIPEAPPGAPTTLDRGEVAMVDSPGPFVVRSQDGSHRFHLSAYMTGSGLSGIGDPEWVNVVPTDRYLTSYLLLTDPSYPETSLVVVRAPSPDDGKFADVVLDCLGALTGWQGVDGYEATRVVLSTGNFVPVGNCANGTHKLTSAAPFTVTVWGWGNLETTPPTGWASYAYVAGMDWSLREIAPPL